MKTLLTFVLLICSVTCFPQQRTYSGSVMDAATNQPLPGVSISVYSDSTLKSAALTDSEGKFSVMAKPGDRIIAGFAGFNSQIIDVTESTPLTIPVLLSGGLKEVVVTAFAGSSANSWVGATLAYNFDGDDPENLIGSSKVMLNTSKVFKGPFRLNVIGNIAKFSGTIDTAAFRKDIREIVQSGQGLSIGLEPLYIIKENGWKGTTLRSWATVNYKVNQFRNVGPEDLKEDVTLSQLRLTAGFEIEGFEMTDGGRKIHLGIEGAVSFFDQEKYFKVFNEKRSSLVSLDWDLVVPVFGDLGFITGQTFCPGIRPVFFAGLIIAQKK